jgi:hypothetical protein
MKKPLFKISFEEGCFDDLEDELTQQELDALIDGIFQLAETGEIFENMTLIDDLPEDEQTEIIDRLTNKKKRTRH